MSGTPGGLANLKPSQEGAKRGQLGLVSKFRTEPSERRGKPEPTVDALEEESFMEKPEEETEEVGAEVEGVGGRRAGGGRGFFEVQYCIPKKPLRNKLE